MCAVQKLCVLVANAHVREKQGVVGKGDLFVVLKYGGRLQRTKPIKNTQNPVWNEAVSIVGESGAETATLQLDVSIENGPPPPSLASSPRVATNPGAASAIGVAAGGDGAVSASGAGTAS